MTSTKYIGMDVHKESISIAVMNAAGKIVMECVIETKASMIPAVYSTGCAETCTSRLRKEPWAAWLYDLLKTTRSTKLVVCDPASGMPCCRKATRMTVWTPRKLAETAAQTTNCVRSITQTTACEPLKELVSQLSDLHPRSHPGDDSSEKPSIAVGPSLVTGQAGFTGNRTIVPSGSRKINTNQGVPPASGI